MTKVVWRNGLRLLGRPSGNSKHCTIVYSDHVLESKLKFIVHLYLCKCNNPYVNSCRETLQSPWPSMQSICLASISLECMKTSILSKSSHWHCIDTPAQWMFDQSNFAVLSDETVDIDDKIKHYLLKTRSYAERERESLEEHGTREWKTWSHWQGLEVLVVYPLLMLPQH